MHAVKRPELLKEDLSIDKPLRAVSVSANVSLRDRSQVTMTLSQNEIPLKMHAFLNIYTDKGLLGVFRVTNFNLSSSKGRTLTLTHAIDTLRDSVWDEQTSFQGTRREFIETLLYHQKDFRWRWRVDRIDDENLPYKSPNINFSKLSDLFAKFLQDNVDLYPVYDFSEIPWRVSLKKLPDDIKGRFSLTRNASTCQINYDEKNMCNVLYLSVNTPEKVNGITKYTPQLYTYYDNDSINEYGFIEKTASVKTDEITSGDYEAWANDFLKKYAQPECSVTVDGYEIWKQTGEIYDAAVVGHRARVHLPEHGVTTIQRIESVQYPDLLNRPRAVVVSLATKQKTFTAAISNLQQEVDKVGGIAGGAALKSANAEEVTTWSLIMTKVKEAVDGTGLSNLWQTGIIIDAETGATIFSLEQGFQAAYSELKVTSQAIEANSKAINLNANKITAKADKIELQGLVKASQLQASVADMLLQNALIVKTPNLEAAEAAVQYLNASSFTYGGTLMSKKQIDMGDVKGGPVVSESTASLNLDHSHAVSVNDADGTITMGAAVTKENAGNFKIADTKAYKDGVSAAKNAVSLSSAGWISGTNTVTASNGKTFPVTLPPFDVSGGTSFNAEHKTTVFFSTESVDVPLKSVVVDASGVYDEGFSEGWVAAKARFRMDWPDKGTYDYLLNIYQPGDTPGSDDIMDELQIGASYSLSNITNTAPNTFYVSGWAYARTRLNGGSWTNRHRVNMTQTNTINVGQG